jgi:hypothetical protein
LPPGRRQFPVRQAAGVHMGKTAIASSRLTDDQLLFMMDQTAEWTVHGRAGVALGLFGSLREALNAVFCFEADDVHVFAVCRHPNDDVIVFREQVGRLADANGRIGRESRRSSAAWPTKTAASIRRRLPAERAPFTTSR